MAKKFALEVTNFDDTQPFESGAPERSIARFINQLKMAVGGANAGTVSLRAFNDLVNASASVTFAALANNDTVTVNGKVLTAKTSGAVAANHEFNLGANDAAAAANLVTLVNASTDAAVSGIFSASALSAVVTFTAANGGKEGNAITIATSNGTRAAITGGVSRLANGSETLVTFSF